MNHLSNVPLLSYLNNFRVQINKILIALTYSAIYFFFHSVLEANLKGNIQELDDIQCGINKT